MSFQIDDKVKYNKPLHIGYKPAPESPNGREKDIRENLVGYVQAYPDRFAPRRVQGVNFIPVRFPESNCLWYLNATDLEKVN